MKFRLDHLFCTRAHMRLNFAINLSIAKLPGMEEAQIQIYDSAGIELMERLVHISSPGHGTSCHRPCCPPCNHLLPGYPFSTIFCIPSPGR